MKETRSPLPPPPQSEEQRPIAVVPPRGPVFLPRRQPLLHRRLHTLVMACACRMAIAIGLLVWGIAGAMLAFGVKRFRRTTLVGKL